MSSDGSIELDWLDGRDRFRLALGELRILQDKCQAGPNTIRLRLIHGSWMVDDIVETIRLGLIGGGLTPKEAMIKVARSVSSHPLAHNVILAEAIISAAIVGVPEDPVGKGEAEGTQTGGSSSPPSTGTEPQLDLPLDK